MTLRLIVHTDRFIPPAFNGRAIGPVVLIRPEFRGDPAVLAHEMVHVRQWWRGMLIHSLRYLWSRSYRMRAEAEAYAAQIDSGGSPMGAALALSAHYDLGITPAEAAAEIDRYREAEG